jgi:hypothetical protein
MSFQELVGKVEDKDNSNDRRWWGDPVVSGIKISLNTYLRRFAGPKLAIYGFPSLATEARF